MTIQANRTYKKKKFEPKSKEKAPVLPRLSREKALAVHQKAMERGARCTECPLFGMRAGPVLNEVVPNARLIVLGDAPGENEILQERPMIGASGKLVEQYVLEGGLAREECTIANACACRPPEEFKAFESRLKLNYTLAWDAWDDARKTSEAAGVVYEAPEPQQPITPSECCFPMVKRDLEESLSKFISAIGGQALKAVARYFDVPFGSAGKAKPNEVRVSTLKKQIGAPLTMPDGTIMVASYHPAFAMRKGSRHYTPIVQAHIKRAAEIARRGYIDWKEPEYLLNPSVELIETTLAKFREVGAQVTIDIETDKGAAPDGRFDPFSCRIRCVGLGAKIDGTEVIIVVPIRRRDGNEWWTDAADKRRVIQALVSTLDYCPLIGHNMTFDTSVLFRFRLMSSRRRLYDDTILLHKNTPANDLPHDLGFVTAQYFEVPSWKGIFSEKHYDQTKVTDEDLHLYNCLHGSSTVVLDDGSSMNIRDIVRHKKEVRVLSRNTESGAVESKRVIGWHRQRVKNQQWRQIQTAATRRGAHGLVLTPEHKVYTERGLLRADEVRRGDNIFYAERKLSATQLQMIYGTLLGDSRLVVAPHFRGRIYDAPTASVDGGHTVTSSLSDFKVTALAPYASAGPVVIRGEAIICGSVCIRDDFKPWHTVNLRQLRQILPLFQDADGTRRLKTEVLDMLGPVGLAHWFMDDGCVQKGARLKQNDGSRGGALYGADSMVLATNSFPRADVEAAVAWFRQHYGPTTAGADNVIRIGIRASRKLAEEIAPFVRAEQRYKLPRRERPYSAFQALDSTLQQPVTETVTVSKAFKPSRADKGARMEAETRWCITVEDNHNFFTTNGLVKNCRDVLSTMRLYDVLISDVYRYGTWSQYEMDRQIASDVRDMGQLGLFVDEVRRGEMSVSLGKEVHSRVLKLREVTKDPNFNPDAPKQIQRFLFREKKLVPMVNTKQKDWEEGEEASTNAASLQKLLTTQACDADTKVFINTLLAYKQYKKLKSTYVDNLRVHYPDWAKHGQQVGWCEEVRGFVWRKYTKTEKRKNGYADDGCWEDKVLIPRRPMISRLHTTYAQHIVPSGRLTTKPAIQNWPCVGKANMRELIIAPPGYVMVGADFDQIELRLYAAIAHDKLILRALAEGKDLHAWNAASLFAKKYKMTIDQCYEFIYAFKGKDEKAWKKHRNIAKTFAFLELYGGEAEKLFQYMSQARDKVTTELLFPTVTQADVDEWHDQWHRMHPETKAFQRTCELTARAEGFTATPIGSYRKRFFVGGANKPGATFNHVIQGAAADCANDALALIAEKIPYGAWGEFSGLCGQVHDWLGVYVPVEREAETIKIIEDSMNRVVFGVSISASAKASDRWSDQ